MSATQDFDTGPLNWVRSDIETALKNAADRVRAHVADPGLENAFRLARDEAHMATGALRMVGLEGAAKVAATLEETMQSLDSGLAEANAASTRVILDTLEALQKWVGRMAEGRGDGELALFPVYRNLRALSGTEQVFEGELFYPNLKVQRAGSNVPAVSNEEMQQRVKAARSSFQRGLLGFLRGVKPEASLTAMHKALVEVEACASSTAAKSFWWACSGFVDALLHKGIEPGLNVKQLLARIDLQMRRLMEGSPQVAERLMRDALFFVATSKALGGDSQAVREAFSLDRYIPKQQYLSAGQMALIRPVLKSIKETLAEARALWNQYSEGKHDALAEFETTSGRLSTLAGALNNPSLAGLVTELHDTAMAMRKLEGRAREASQLEIATTLLFLQNAADSEDILDTSFPSRAQSQIRRLYAARMGKAEADATDLVDETSQKAADHALFTQLAKEIGSSLQQMEEHLDAFFRDPDARDGLASLESFSSQVQGALSIMDLPEASELLQTAIGSMRPYVIGGEPEQQEKNRVADALSSLGLFVEAHCAGRQDATRILRPAQAAYGLIPQAMEEEEEQTVEAGLAGRKTAVADAYSEWQSAPNDETRKKCLAALTELANDAELIADASLKSATAAALSGVRDQAHPTVELAAQISTLTGEEIPAPGISETNPGTLVAEAAMDIELLPESLEAPQAAGSMHAESAPENFGALDFTPAEPAFEGPEETIQDANNSEQIVLADTGSIEFESTQELQPALEEAGSHYAAISVEAAEEPAPAPEQISAVQVESEVDSEILEIFLEEAAEVLYNLGNAADACEINSHDHGNLTVIRRAFHTLKGSGRMAGLSEFGEAAWGMEQLMNGWLAAEKPATPVLLEVVRKAKSLFGEWISQLHQDSKAWMDYSPLLADAHAVAHGADETAQSQDMAEQAPAEICIGTVCLSPSLFEVFKAESARWAEELQEESNRLSNTKPAFSSDIAKRAVHTLAGIGGTTGFKPLSSLAMAVETYLMRLENRPVPTEALNALLDGYTALRGMIQEIHSGVLPAHAEALIQTLTGLPAEVTVAEVISIIPAEEESVEEPGELPQAEIEAIEIPATAEFGTEFEIPSVEADKPIEFAEVAAAEEIGQFESADQSETGIPAIEVAEPPEEPEQPAALEGESSLQEMLEHARQAAAPVFEQRVVQDEIDEVLLPIFLEEADTLVPEAARSIREWKNNPASGEAPSALRRILHTVKGSSRMAGAMRLGELTHIMESRVIAVLEGQLKADAAVFEKLENEFDRMADTIDHLRSGTSEPATVHTETEVTETDVLMPANEEVGEAPAQQAVVQTVKAAETPAQREAASLRVRSDWVDRMVNQAGEVAIARTRIESEMYGLKRQVTELSDALRRLKDHLREVEIQAESQMQATFQSQTGTEHFDPLEFDRFTRFQEVTRFMAESVHDVSTVQQNLALQLDEADAALLQQSRINRELQQNLLRVRMVPLYSVSERLYRVVRQAARDADKRAQLDISGGDLELDRGVLEKVVAPLEHLLRNSIAHGLESPEGRAAASKPEFGEVSLIARHEGNEMVLIVKDDGAGLNLDRIREKAISQGLLDSGVEAGESQLAQLIFHAGFSTASEVTQLAGRGVGMDVVKNEIASLGGRIEISTETGKGVTFTIYLPLTLAVAQAVIINANRNQYALPATLVEQVQELKPDQLDAAMQARAIEWRNNRYPLFYLPHLLGQNDAQHEVQRFNTIVLMKSGTSYAGLLVDQVEGTREIVVKNIGPQLSRVSGIAGATVRGDGKVILILNPVPLATRALEAPEQEAPLAVHHESVPEPAQAPLVLVVDDSLTVRKITSRLMTREGYRVETAKDGVDALEKMQDITPDIILLDVEMPRMDGFELARVVRNDAKLKRVPIIMITSRTAEKHRSHAAEIGVNVYLGKPFQEAILLGNIAELLGERAMVPA